MDFTTGSGAYSIAIGDADGDGKPDLAVAGRGDNTVSIFRNASTIGSVSFAAKVDFTTGSNPYSVAIDDVDGDGKPDLAVANWISNTVSVFRNTGIIGSVSFSAKVDFTTGSNPQSVAIGDVDGDGKPDLAVANNGSNTVSVLRNTIAPQTPQNLTATAGNGQVTLKWNKIAENRFLRYRIFMSTTPNASTTKDSTAQLLDTVKTITGLTNGTTYYFRVKAVDSSYVESAYSNEVSATPQENITGILQDFENAAASSLFKTYSTDPSLGTGTGYVVLSDITNPTPVQGSASMQCEWKMDANQTWGGVQNMSHFVPQANHQYIDLSSAKYLSIWYNNTVPSSQPGYVFMRFLLYEAGGNSQYWSNQADYEAWYFEAAPGLYDAAPGWKQLIMPLNDRGTLNPNNSGYSLPGWQGKRNNGVLDLDKIVGFSIEVDCGIQGTVATGTCLWDNLQYGTILSLPNAPTGISAIADNNQITLIWNKNTEPDFLRYRIYLSTSTNPTIKVDSTTGGVSDTSKVIYNLNNGTMYYLRITAVNTAGLESGFSEEVKAIPVGPPTTSLFAAKVDLPTGSNPGRLAVGDIDGDGKPDVVAANSNSNTFSIIRNTCAVGNASFAAKTDFATVKGSFAVALVGDVDRDGKLDVVISNNGGDTVSVYRNTSTIGNVGFAPRVDFVVGSYPYFISIDDVDGDGKLDLIVETNNDLAGNENFKVSIFRNTSTSGNVSFAQRVDFSTGTGHNDMTTGDLDGDGKPDIALANWSGNSVSVLRNISTIGTINFEPKVDYTAGIEPSDVLIGDINGDGKPDIIVPNCGDNTVSIFRNTCSSGTLSFAEKVDFTTGSGPGEVAIGDIDQDGKPDIVVVNDQANSISFFSNTSMNGTVSFASRVDFTTGVNPEPISIVDLDGDGKSDVVVGNCNSNTISVFRNTVTPAPLNITSFTPTRNALNVAKNTNITITFNRDVDPAKLTHQRFALMDRKAGCIHSQY